MKMKTEEKAYTIYKVAALVFQNKLCARLLYKLCHEGNMTDYRRLGRSV